MSLTNTITNICSNTITREENLSLKFQNGEGNWMNSYLKNPSLNTKDFNEQVKYKKETFKCHRKPYNEVKRQFKFLINILL